MPSYDYECQTCGTFTEFRPISERDVPASCMICDEPAPRVISAPNLALMNPLHRMAATRNERSRHEPRVGLKSSCCSGRSCVHKKAAPTTRDGKPALRGSKKKNRRPWMLGH
ncbi:MAG: FmdB family zinc ribbon protein [Chthoniobacter sp.]